MLETLEQNQGTWGRMWDMPDKEEARKRSNFVTKKGFSFAVRQTPHGWSVFGRFNGYPAEEPGTEPEPTEQAVVAEETAGTEEPVRESTFQ